MTKLQIILAVCGAGFAAFNYTVYLIVSKRASLPLSVIVLLCIALPLIAFFLFGKKLGADHPVLLNVLKWAYISAGLFYTVTFTVFSILITNVKETTDKADPCSQKRTHKRQRS